MARAFSWRLPPGWSPLGEKRPPARPPARDRENTPRRGHSGGAWPGSTHRARSATAVPARTRVAQTPAHPGGGVRWCYRRDGRTPRSVGVFPNSSPIRSEPSAPRDRFPRRVHAGCGRHRSSGRTSTGHSAPSLDRFPASGTMGRQDARTWPSAPSGPRRKHRSSGPGPSRPGESQDRAT